ncbi:MAG: hypothetical protein J6B45_00190 [Clostridia bacterium]|nr:hypothetical protein [Clostridia bacterium]
MKKIYILFVLLCLCILMVACGQKTSLGGRNSIVDSGEKGETTGTNSSIETEKPYVDPAPVRFYKIEEYENFIETQGLADGFVGYEDVCEFGEFYCMHFIHYFDGGWNGDANAYRYIVIDDNGNMIDIDIHQNGEEFRENYEKISEEYINKADLRFAKGMKTGVYENNEIQYLYTNGELHGVSWKASGKRYLIWGEELVEYPLATEKETVIQKLLNLETAKDALIGIYGEAFGK